MKQAILRFIIAIMAIMPLAQSTFTASAEAVKSDDVVILTPVRKPNNDPRMPGKKVEAIYSDGFFSCPAWFYTDEAATVTVTAPGCVPATIECQGTELVTGVYIGVFDSFEITVTTASGVEYHGSLQAD